MVLCKLEGPTGVAVGIGDKPAEQGDDGPKVEKGADRWSALSVRGESVVTVLEDVQLDSDGSLVLKGQAKEGQYLRYRDHMETTWILSLVVSHS